MHLLYVDESGSATDASQKYFVLAGVSVFERTTHWIEKGLDDIAVKVDPVAPQDLELHGSPMRSGKGMWRKMDMASREALILEALYIGVVRQPKGVRLFACVVEKAALAGKDPVHVCFEQLARRFDLFLQRCHTKHGDPQRGIMLFDESSTEKRLQTLAREFKRSGHSYGKTATMRRSQCSLTPVRQGSFSLRILLPTRFSDISSMVIRSFGMLSRMV
jgi:hypothetical protein